MVDKIIYKSANEVVIIFTDRSPFTVTSDRGDALTLADQLLCPFNAAGITSLAQYRRVEAVSEEDTQVINLDEVG